MENNYDYCFLITTFNRSSMLYSLINQIKSQKKNYKILIIVFDDGSSENYKFDDPFVKYIKFYPNYGKKRYWKVTDTIFKYIQKINSNYFIQIPDDVEIVENFFELLTNTYEGINDPDKICLSFLTDSRVFRHNWTSFDTQDMGNVYKTQWNDLCYFSKKNFFETLNFTVDPISPSRWVRNPNLSSGVGQQISLKLKGLNKNMYHTKNSLVSHGTHESKMNYQERINLPITTL